MTTIPTNRTVSLLLFISDYLQAHGMPPSIREMGQHEGVSSTSTVNYWLLKLEADGYIERRRGIPRSTKLTMAGLERIGLKKLTVAA